MARAALPTLVATVLVPSAPVELAESGVSWEGFRADAEEVDFAPLALITLWILYSSGTTGLPKAIVHGHGGILLEHLKALALHCDLGEDDRFFWFTTTGWMMWNFLISGLLLGSTVLLYDGSPGYPDLNALWRFAADSGMTYFGTSAPYCSPAGRRGCSQAASSI